MEYVSPLFTRKSLFRLIWPLLIEQLLAVLVGMIDVLMVSYLGEYAISGVSLVDSINHLVLMVLTALTAGGTVVCGHFVGAGDKAKAGKSGAQLFLCAGSLMLLLCICFLIGRRPLLGLLFGSIETEVMDNAVKYMLFTTLSYPFLAIQYTASSVLRAEGNTRMPMLVSLGMNVLNILGNAVCIFLLDMDVTGVAIPTLLARIAAAAVMILLYQRRDHSLRIRSVSMFRPDKTIIRNILSISVPNSIESSMFNIGKVLLTSLVASLGTDSIAAYAVASNLVTYLYLPGNALGAAMSTVVSQCRGAGQREEAKKHALTLTVLTYLMLAVICAVMIAGKSFFVRCYQLDGISASLAESLLLAHSLGMVIWPTAFTIPYYFRACGQAKFTMIVALAAMVFFRIALAYIFVLLFNKNVVWIWYAMLFDWLFRTIVFVRRFRKKES